MLKNWEEIDLNQKTLHDFDCPNCGGVSRIYLAYWEFSKTWHCKCGGVLESRLGVETLSKIMALSDKHDRENWLML